MNAHSTIALVLNGCPPAGDTASPPDTVAVCAGGNGALPSKETEADLRCGLYTVYSACSWASICLQPLPAPCSSATSSMTTAGSEGSLTFQLGWRRCL